MKTFFIGFSILAAVFYTACNSRSEGSNITASSPNSLQTGPIISNGIRQLANKQACMVNNRFMGKDQIPALANKKMYYGCCEGCVAALKKDDLYHYADDPTTGQQVDKSMAVIILKPGSSEDVLYFASTETAKKYIDEKVKLSSK